MSNKLLIAVNVIVFSAGVIVALQLNAVIKSVGTLTQRVTDLEVQNVQLSKQFEWMEQQKALADRSPSANRKYANRSGYMSRNGSVPGRPSVSSHTSAGTPFSQETWEDGNGDNGMPAQNDSNSEMVDDHNFEQQGKVNPEQWENHQSDWENGLRDRMENELDNFAEENALDDAAKTHISDLLAESVDRRRELRNKMASNNLSLKEYIEQNRKLGEEIAGKSSTYLTDEQQEKFINKFHMGSKPVKRRPKGTPDISASRSEDKK